MLGSGPELTGICLGFCFSRDLLLLFNCHGSHLTLSRLQGVRVMASREGSRKDVRLSGGVQILFSVV